MKAVPSFETPGINNRSTQGDRPEDLNPRRQSRGQRVGPNLFKDRVLPALV